MQVCDDGAEASAGNDPVGAGGDPHVTNKKGINFVTKVPSSQIQFTVHNISIRLSVGKNMRRVDQFKRYNFLNLEVRGLRKLNSNLYMAGLLVRDDHTAFSKVPQEC